MKNRFRILLGEACSQRAAATGLIKTDAGQYSQKLVGAMAPEKSLSALVGRSMAPEESQQLAQLKPMPAGIRQNWPRKGHMKNRFRILLGGAWPRRAAATCLIKTNAGQYSQKLVGQRVHENSLSGQLDPDRFPMGPRTRPFFTEAGFFETDVGFQVARLGAEKNCHRADWA
jgi:hypothetical protein